MNGYDYEGAKVFYEEVTKRGVTAREPFVGNGMHVVELRDRDGYEIIFQSSTDDPDTDWLQAKR